MSSPVPFYQSGTTSGPSHNELPSSTTTPQQKPYENGGATTSAHTQQQQRGWFDMTRTIAHYEREIQIGEGTYGQVYRARCKDTNRKVALKKIRVHHGGYWGIPPTVIREIKILKRLKHPRLVEMIEVVSSKGVEFLDENDEHREDRKEKEKQQKAAMNGAAGGGGKEYSNKVMDAREGYKGNLFLVLEYVSHDLTGLLDIAYRFKPQEIKSIFKQLMEGLAYMHEQKYVHRDIKSSNILIDSYFRVKLADFGLARSIEELPLLNIKDRGAVQDFTNKVITLWYRPPEILLGATRYGCAVDVWSAGCILAELLLGRPLFTGQKELEQLELIFDMMGTPTPSSWEGLGDLKLFRTGEVELSRKSKSGGKKNDGKLRERYGHKMPNAAMNLLEKLLELDPSKRLTAGRALNSRYFLAEPRAPDNPEELGRIQLCVDGSGEAMGEFHEFQTKKKRKEAKSLANKAKEEALERGLSEKDADAIFDEAYREEMKRVQIEGNSALLTKEEMEKRDRRNKSRGGGDNLQTSSSSTARKEERKGGSTTGEDRKSRGGEDGGRSSKRERKRSRSPEDRPSSRKSSRRGDEDHHYRKSGDERRSSKSSSRRGGDDDDRRVGAKAAAAAEWQQQQQQQPQQKQQHEQQQRRNERGPPPVGEGDRREKKPSSDHRSGDSRRRDDDRRERGDRSRDSRRQPSSHEDRPSSSKSSRRKDRDERHERNREERRHHDRRDREDDHRRRERDGDRSRRSSGDDRSSSRRDGEDRGSSRREDRRRDREGDRGRDRDYNHGEQPVSRSGGHRDYPPPPQSRDLHYAGGGGGDQYGGGRHPQDRRPDNDGGRYGGPPRGPPPLDRRVGPPPQGGGYRDDRRRSPPPRHGSGGDRDRRR